MSSRYKFRDPEGAYFVTFAVVEWIDVFTRNEYREIIIDSLNWCQKNKDLIIFSWCLMPNHLHLLIGKGGTILLQDILRDFKKFTSTAIIRAIRENPRESRKDWMLGIFKKCGSESSNVKHLQFWRHDNRPIQVWSNKVIKQKINYIHNNPVVGGLVLRPEDYPYSSARDYSGEKGYVEIVYNQVY